MARISFPLADTSRSAWLWLARVLEAAGRKVVRPRGDRGDVPGWVMVTVMTAGLVAAVFAVFRDAIVSAVQTALAQVVSTTGG